MTVEWQIILIALWTTITSLTNIAGDGHSTLTPQPTAEQTLYRTKSHFTAESCSLSDRARLANDWKTAFNKNPLFSACPESNWTSLMWRAVKNSNKTSVRVLDIGANKGYWTAEMLALLGRGNPKYIPQAINGYWRKQKVHKACGACEDCKAKVKLRPRESSPHSLRFQLYEPTKETYLGVRKLFTGNPHVEVYPFAVSDKEGMAQFRSKGNAHETNGLVLNGSQNLVSKSFSLKVTRVRTTTLDAILGSDFAHARKPKSDFIFVKIDAEGFDPLVLRGASTSLERNVIDGLMFEYGKQHMWENTLLKDVIDWLDSLGYTCFWDAQVPIQITGCWVPEYECNRWSNIVCAVREQHAHMLLHILQGVL
uniref:Methyltransferase FkbM domain-containing protein n=1 Tax=Tetraselmis sp. GSL018 TaxID=582737 RepID=A0A061RNA3_9CHLO|mmetsp:Transcript_41459/g.98233  ORF Transcript_41459/g.98233 Transcript_41459/m.98233 type:complete len:367 (-) Transcript_41459:394-1494(-)